MGRLHGPTKHALQIHDRADVGEPGALKQGEGIELEFRTEKEFDKGHGIWFNRGGYGDRIEDAIGSVMFTAAFGVTEKLVPSLSEDCDYLRFILMEKPASETLKATLTEHHDCVIAYGAVLGEMYKFNEKGKPVARRRIKDFELDKWYLEEEHGLTSR